MATAWSNSSTVNTQYEVAQTNSIYDDVIDDYDGTGLLASDSDLTYDGYLPIAPFATSFTNGSTVPTGWT